MRLFSKYKNIVQKRNMSYFNINCKKEPFFFRKIIL